MFTGLSKRAVAFGTAWLFALAPLPALAAEKLPASVQTMVTAAEKAFAAADFGRASELFEQAWKASPHSTTLLYNAARAAELTKDLDRADDLYQKYLGLTGHEAKFLEKAKAYLLDVQAGKKALKVAKAKEKANDAEKLRTDRRYHESAAAFRLTYLLDEANLEYLRLAGMTAALGCDEGPARAYLNEYMAKGPPDSPQRTDAQLRLDGLAKDCAKEAKVPVVAAQTVAPAPAPAAGPGRTIGMIATIGGVVIAGVGAGLYFGASSDGTKLVSDMNANVYPGSYAAATSDRSAIEGRMTTGAVVVGVGAVAAAAGVVLWLSSGPSSSAAIVPTSNGFSLAVAF